MILSLYASIQLFNLHKLHALSIKSTSWIEMHDANSFGCKLCQSLVSAAVVNQF